MADDFDNHYDINDGDGYHDQQEEAHFYFTIAEFEWLIKEHGCAFVLSKLDTEIYKQIKEKINV
jgi:hypothetical protein